MLKRKPESGFTLIELLVVIAIIGILSGIVITALGGARVKSRQAKIQSEMSQLRSGAELYALENNGYYNSTGDNILCNQLNYETNCSGTFFGDDKTGSKYVKSIDKATSRNGMTMASNSKSWAMSVVLPDKGGVLTANKIWWCVDSSGFSGRTKPLSSGVRLVGDKYQCQPAF